MKLPLHLVVYSGIAVPAIAFSSWSSGSSSSAFTGRLTTTRRLSFGRNDMLMYDTASDPPNNGDSSNNPWAILATTERWLSDTLSSQGSQNPYTRKEVTYVCESSDEGAMIIAGIFRRLREAREQGELHGQAEEDRLMEQGTDNIIWLL